MQNHNAKLIATIATALALKAVTAANSGESMSLEAQAQRHGFDSLQMRSVEPEDSRSTVAENQEWQLTVNHDTFNQSNTYQLYDRNSGDLVWSQQIPVHADGGFLTADGFVVLYTNDWIDVQDPIPLSQNISLSAIGAIVGIDPSGATIFFTPTKRFTDASWRPAIETEILDIIVVGDWCVAYEKGLLKRTAQQRLVQEDRWNIINTSTGLASEILAPMPNDPAVVSFLGISPASVDDSIVLTVFVEYTDMPLANVFLVFFNIDRNQSYTIRLSGQDRAAWLRVVSLDEQVILRDNGLDLICPNEDKKRSFYFEITDDLWRVDTVPPHR